MKTYYVYILKCSDNSYYIGITNDVDKRFGEHQQGINPGSYTYKRRPVELVFFEPFNSPIDAITFEKRIKGWSRKKKEALIERNWDKLKHHSKCKNDTSHTNFKV